MAEAVGPWSQFQNNGPWTQFQGQLGPWNQFAPKPPEQDPNELAMQAKIQQGMQQGPMSLLNQTKANPLELGVGLAEQIPAGIQAAASVAEKIYGGAKGLLDPNSTAAQGAKQQQEEFSGSPISKALTPRSETGQAISAAIGSAIGRGQQALQTPEVQEKYLGKEIAHGPVGASIAAFAEIAPDLAIAYGLKRPVPKPQEVPLALDKIIPGEGVPTNPIEAWKQQGITMLEKELPPDSSGERIGSQYGGRTAGPIEEQTLLPKIPAEYEHGVPYEPLSLAPKEPYRKFVNPKEDVFQGGGGKNFQLRQEVLDSPELRHAVESVITTHQDLSNKITNASDRDLPGLIEQRDALEERFASEMRNYGITKKSDAYGRALYDTIPDGMWQALRVKIEQQNSRQFTGALTDKTDINGLTLRRLDPGIENPSQHDLLGGHYPDAPIPIISIGKVTKILDPVNKPYIKQSLDVNSILDHISENTKNPIYRAIAKNLRAFDIPKMGVSFNIAMDKGQKVMLGIDHRALIGGHFIIGSKEVEVGMRGMTERIVLHELVHAVTARAFLSALKAPIKAIMEGGTWEVDRNHPLAKPVQSLIDAWSKLSNIAEDFHPEEFRQRYAGGKFYGLVNPLEMMAEVGTNPEFMKWLNHQVIFKKEKPTTMLGKVREAFKQILGKDTTESALDHIMFHTSEVANAYAQMPHKWDKFFNDIVTQELFTPPNVVTLNHVISKIPGLEDASWLQEVGSFERAKAKIINEPDGGATITGDESRLGRTWEDARNNIGKLLMPGYIMAKEIRDSTMIQNVGRIMTNAGKRAEMFIERWSDPVEKTVSRLNSSDRDALHSVFMTELQHNSRFSPDQLKQIGMTPKLIDAYQTIRAGLDASINRINEIRGQRELKSITPLEAYHAAVWDSGMYRADIVDAQGKKIWGLSEKTAYERQQAMNWILKKNPELRVVNQKIAKVTERLNTLQAGYLEMLGFLDKDDPRTQALKSTFEELTQTKTENVAGQEKHFLVKSGVRGYLGDRPWAKGNSTDFFDAQVKYMQGAAKWTEFQSAFTDAIKYTTDPELRTKQPNNVSYAEEYIKHQMGFGTNKQVAAIEKSIASVFGKDPSTFMRIVSVGKKFFYPIELSVKLPFIEISLLQHGFSMAQHAMLDSKGYVAKNTSYLLDGFRYGTQHALLDAKEFGLSANPNIPGLNLIQPMNGVWAHAREYAAANKILDQNPLTEAKDIRSGPTQNTIENIANFTTAITEKVARGWTFYGLVSHLVDSGKFDLKSKESMKEMFRLAEESTQITMGDYRPLERSMVFNKMGILGKAASALKTYPTNMMGQLMLYSKEAARGNVAPLGYFLAMQFAVGGLRGMFAVDDIDAAWQCIKRHLLPASLFDYVRDWGIKKWMTEHLSDFMYHGPIAATTGNNISVQGSMGKTIPGLQPLLEGNVMDAANTIFPSIHENIALAKAVGEAVGGGMLAHTTSWVPKPTPNETQEAIYEATPTGAKGLLKERDPTTLFTTRNPNFHAPNNPDLMLNPHDLKEGEYTRNQDEHNLGKYGFVSPKEQRWVDAAHAMKENKSVMDEHRKEVVLDLEEYALKGNADQVRRLMILYWDLGGQVDKVSTEISKAAIEKMTDMKQRAILDMQTQNNPEKLIMARDFLKALSPQ
jgi:hypothetical protein